MTSLHPRDLTYKRPLTSARLLAASPTLMICRACCNKRQLFIDASGAVIWMAAGEELFAAAAFGYPPQVIQKLGPLNRSAINATAAAWRTSTLQAVTGGQDGRGALAAPMLGPDRCVGVLAVELGIGHDGDAGRRAISMMFAAQLAAALAGWPAASAAAPVDVPPLERAAEH